MRRGFARVWSADTGSLVPKKFLDALFRPRRPAGQAEKPLLCSFIGLPGTSSRACKQRPASRLSGSASAGIVARLRAEQGSAGGRIKRAALGCRGEALTVTLSRDLAGASSRARRGDVRAAIRPRR